ncbi:MAG: hypothetical protein AAB965_02990 [Patescibacteria group bacterium]
MTSSSVITIINRDFEVPPSIFVQLLLVNFLKTLLVIVLIYTVFLYTKALYFHFKSKNKTAILWKAHKNLLIFVILFLIFLISFRIFEYSSNLLVK